MMHSTTLTAATSIDRRRGAADSLRMAIPLLFTSAPTATQCRPPSPAAGTHPGDERLGAGRRAAGGFLSLGGLGRARRVELMVALLVAASLSDLYLTVLFATHVGFAEANPLARLVMQHGDVAGVVLLKLLTLLPAVVVLLWKRTRPSAELGALVACAAMALLGTSWYQYVEHTPYFCEVIHLLTADVDHRWVRMRAG